ncbi:prenyltransferase [Thiomicrorhabdus sediminis]|uniref:Prenyltransferase n=1 Tax=Thiomicrorhabdus sediminis TaxID=2580412 RepID=A0A4P9K5C2_9GAMM|nr:prenyltransferase [Thiomicrorhabdus sediminis]QCU90214.1 prenyltransferase [Thiomicrorhabdus sediminis]
MDKFTVVLQTMRPNFLTLAPVVIALVVSIEWYQGHAVDYGWLALIVVGALFAHISVNMLNEIQDFQSGLDKITPKTPFSGGSGALVDAPQMTQAVYKGFLVVMALLCLIGMLMVWYRGWPILLIGVIGMLLIIAYTRYITHMPWLCLIAPGLAFGPLIMMGADYVLTGRFSGVVLVLSMAVFFLVNNLLLLNQAPDIKADRTVGRFNIWMRLGQKGALRIFTLFSLMGFIVLVFAIEYYQLPAMLWLTLLALPLALFSVMRAYKAEMQISQLMPALAANVVLNHLLPILLIAGFWLAA